MITVVLLAAAAGVLLGVPRPIVDAPAERAAVADPVRSAPGAAHVWARLADVPGRRATAIVLGLVLVAAPAMGGLTRSAVPVVLAPAAGALVLHRLHRRNRQLLLARRRAETVVGLRVLASMLRSGAGPGAALAEVARRIPPLDPATLTVMAGGDPCPALYSAGDQPGYEGLAALAACWQVSRETGAHLSVAVEGAATAVAASAAALAEVDVELSGPRASARLLAVLPLGGLVLGQLLGAEPLDLLLHSGFGQGAALAALVLAWSGYAWTEALVSRVGRLAR
ncbi:MAG: type II secretion system F family protein [Actinomycetes bacterium]